MRVSPRSLAVLLGIVAVVAVAFLASRAGSSVTPQGQPAPAAPVLAGQAEMPAAQSPAEAQPPADSTLPTAYASTVDFADVAISTEIQPDSMVERWRRGELRQENESIIPEWELEQQRAASLRLPPDPSVQSAPEGGAAPVPAGTAFDSIDFNDSGGWVPPDPEMAVGPNHIIAVVNVAVEIYSKTGTSLLGPTGATNLFTQTICKSGLYDPNVLYDEEADRFMIAYDKGPASATGGYCVLVSQTGNPLGTWNEYYFPTNSSAGWLDYPHAGIGDEYIVMGGNVFSLGGGYIEGRIYAFDKDAMYAGSPVTAVVKGLTSSYSTPQPLRLHGFAAGTWPAYGNSHYVLVGTASGGTFRLYRWDIPTNSLVTVGDVVLPAAGQPVNWPQSGGSPITGNDRRGLDFEFRNGYGWMAQHVACNPGAGTVNCLRWAQINLASAALGPAGFGTYASDGVYRVFPDVAVNHCNDMAIGYTRGSSTTFPSVYVTGRENGDPSGTLQAEVQMKAGEIAYTAFDGSPYRWGDYTGMTIDPNGLTFWYLGEYSKNTGTTSGRWGNYIASFSYPSCVLGPTPTPTLTPTPSPFQLLYLPLVMK